MPRLEKVRIVGVRYDSMRKRYDDTTLDLMNGAEPAHTLLTLMNGGGKGLLLQMIFQLLLPLTKWGAKGENRIEALFYNERKQFVPYTFHVALEWRLDTDPVKWLITGIAVSAREKAAASENEQESAEPRYAMYTLEQVKPGNYEIEDLPLLDRATGSAVSLDDWKSYVAARRSDFTLYTHTQTRDYYELLRTYDIDRKEWETLRDINRQEGGVEAFFRKGQDNHSLFHDLIIPEIGKHMAGTDEEGRPGTLLDIFKHNAAIVQHLPKLLKREEGYRLLLQGIDPLISSLAQGAGLERRERDHRHQGALIRHALKEWLGEQSKEKLQWQAELDRAEEEARELRWREDNCDYAAKSREVAVLERQLAAHREQHAQLRDTLAACEAAETRMRATVLWNEREQARQKAEQLRQELDLLERADEHRQVREEIEQARDRLRAEWARAAADWRRSILRYGRLTDRIAADRAQAEREQESLHRKELELTKRLGGVTGQLQALNTEKMAMERAFGRLANEAPERLAEQLRKQVDRLRLVIKEREQEQEQVRQEREALLVRAAGLQESIRQSALTIEQAQRGLLDRREREEQAGRRTAVYLKLDRDMASGQAASSSWLQEGQSRLASEMARLEGEEADGQRRLWTHQLDASLADQDYWIPNQEMQKLKSALEEQAVRCYYGAELLASLPEEEREDHLAAYPLLPYSLIVLESEWKKRDTGRLAALLLRAPVPVYVREAMRHAGGTASREAGMSLLQDGALLLVGESAELARSKERWDRWKQELQRAGDELREAADIVKERLAEGRSLAQALKELAATPDSSALESQLEQLTRERDALEQQRREASDRKEQAQQTIRRLESQLGQTRQELGDLTSRLDKLAAWSERLEQGREWQEQKAGLEREIALRQQERTALDERIASLADELRIWERTYLDWRHQQTPLLARVKRFIAEASFSFELAPAGEPYDGQADEPDAGLTAIGDGEPADGRSGESEEVESVGERGGESEDARNALFVQADAGLPLLVTALEGLTASLEEKNRKIAELGIHLTYASGDVSAREQALDGAFPGWQQASLPVMPLEVARSEQAAAERKRNAARREAEASERQQSRIEGKLEAEQASLFKLERDIREKHGRAADAWAEEDLASLSAELRLKKEQNRAHLAESQRLLGGIEQSIVQLDKQLSVLSSQQISNEAVFDLPADIRRSVRADSAAAVSGWVDAVRELADAKMKLDREVADQRNRFLQFIRDQVWDAELSGSLQQMLGQIRWDEYGDAIELLASVKEHAIFELESLASDKSKAEQARDIWTDRACYRVVSIAKALRQMTSRMSFVNQGGYRYPLIRMDLRGGELPDKPEDVRLLLREFFIRTIDELTARYPDISQAPDAELEKRMSDSQIVWTALKNRYPTLHVYKPQTTNVFLFESPKKHHYTEWETLNKGSLTEAKGSGGQLLAARTIVMMMLMTHKRQLRQTTMWSVLILDNPFGQAVSPHILDPIFAIAENLHFQWIVLAPPELIKLDVSRRFPVFWELELKRQADGEAVTERLQHGGRSFEGEFDLFSQGG